MTSPKNKDVLLTHIPLKDYFDSQITTAQKEQRTLIDEREKQYNARFRASEIAVAAALLAQKEAVESAFLASEKAIIKAEEAQKDYNHRSNEFRGQLDDQAKTLMPRMEMQSILATLRDNIDRISDNLNKEITMTREHEAIAAVTYLTRAEAKATFDAAVNERIGAINRINALEQISANIQGRMWAMGVGVTILSIIVSTIIHFIR